jgi:opacity protein-like surface antigen
VGVGVEYALMNNVTTALEYRYTAYDEETFSLGGIGFPNGQTSTVTATLDEPMSAITARVNFKLGRP